MICAVVVRNAFQMIVQIHTKGIQAAFEGAHKSKCNLGLLTARLRWYYTWHIIIPHACRTHSAASALQAEAATPLFWWCGSKLHVLLEVFCGPLSTKFRRRNAAFFVPFMYWVYSAGFIFVFRMLYKVENRCFLSSIYKPFSL